MAKNFYIRERHNPQFDKPYYVAHGQLTKKEAKIWEKTRYGENYMLSYSTEQEYKDAIKKLTDEGFHFMYGN